MNPMSNLPVPGMRPRKRRSMGCLITTTIIMAILAGAAYFFVYKPVSQLAKGFSNIEAFTNLDKHINNTAPFAPPVNDELSADQVDRYIGVIQRVQADAMARINDLEHIFNAELLEDAGPVEAYRIFMGAYQELIDSAVAVKQEQVEAINAAGFSLEEYNWVKTQVAGAAGFSASELSLESLMSGELGGQQVAIKSNPTNQELIAPYMEDIGSWAPLLMFGL